MSYMIVTDTSANLPSPLLRERDIKVLPFSYFIDGKEYNCLDTESFDSAAFYGAIRKGTKVNTSLVPPQVYHRPDKVFRIRFPQCVCAAVSACS